MPPLPSHYRARTPALLHLTAPRLHEAGRAARIRSHLQVDLQVHARRATTLGAARRRRQSIADYRITQDADTLDRNLHDVAGLERALWIHELAAAPWSARQQNVTWLRVNASAQ